MESIFENKLVKSVDCGFKWFFNWADIEEEITRNIRPYGEILMIETIYENGNLAIIMNNCRDFSALTLEVIFPSKLQDGLDELTDVNSYVLTLRRLWEDKATTTGAIIGVGVVATSICYMIIHGEYITT